MWNDETGFSLIELIITIIVISLGAGVIYSFLEAVVSSPEPSLRARALALGKGLMDEIVAKRWDENSPLGGGNTTSPSTTLGPDGGETDRTLYDDVDDYNGFSEQDTFSDQEGNTIQVQGVRRWVRVDYIQDSANTIDKDTPSPSTSPTNTKRIVVSVSTPSGEEFRLVATRCNY